jgi:hypothetical protein
MHEQGIAEFRISQPRPKFEGARQFNRVKWRVKRSSQNPVARRGQSGVERMAGLLAPHQAIKRELPRESRRVLRLGFKQIHAPAVPLTDGFERAPVPAADMIGRHVKNCIVSLVELDSFRVGHRQEQPSLRRGNRFEYSRQSIRSRAINSGQIIRANKPCPAPISSTRNRSGVPARARSASSLPIWSRLRMNSHFSAG